MGLTRNKLKALGIEAEKIDEIIESHMETVNALKTELDEAKSSKEELDKVKAERDKYADEVKTLKASKSEDETYKEKYEKVQDEFNKYKDNQKAEATKASKEKAYRQMLADVGVSANRIDAVMRVTDVNAVELDENGAIKGADTLKESLTKEWGDFIETKGTKGTKSYNPPANDGKGKTKEEILAIKDTAERQRMIAENIDLFN